MKLSRSGMMALVLAAGSVVSAYFGSAAPRPPLGPLIAIPPEVDLGQIKQGKSYTALFELRNQSPEVLRISQIQGSCSCTSHQLASAEIMPGASTSLTLTYSSRSSRGAVSTEAAVLFFTKDLKNIGRLDCVVTGQVVPNIQLSSESLTFQAGVSSSVELDLSPQTIPHFTVQEAACASDAFSVAVMETTPQRTRLRVSFDPSRLSPEVNESELSIAVDDPVVPLLRIPLVVERVVSGGGSGR